MKYRNIRLQNEESEEKKKSKMNVAYRKLGTNILMFAISSFGTKIIGFLLVPLYTSFLTTTEYGIADMLYTILSIILPVFSIDIADGVIRYVLDKNYRDSSVLLVAIKMIFLGSLVLVLSLGLVRVTSYLSIPNQYYGFLFLNFVFTSLYNIFVNYLKGKERIKNLVVAGLMCSLLNAGGNILFLTKLGMGVNGYLLANVISVAMPMLYLVICSWRYGYLNFDKLHVNKQLEKEMLVYSAPLILNGLAWWMNNSLDRVFVTIICGMSANGLLAVAYKIPSILSMLQTIFNQAWSLSAIKEFDPKDKDGFIGKVYSYYGCAMTITSSALLLVNVILAKILFANDFFEAWRYTGMLVIANLFGGLSVCISGVFNAVKDTRTLAITTSMGGIVNAVLNAILIPQIGVQGAVFATMISNLVVWGWRMHKVRSYITLNLRIMRDILSYILIITQSIMGLARNHLYIVQIVVCICIATMYRHELIHIVEIGVSRVKKLKQN